MSNQNNRRNFINILLLIWSGITAIPIISGIMQFITPPKIRRTGSVILGKREEIQPKTSEIIEIAGVPVIVIINESGEITAFGANCTHLGCVVGFREEKMDIYCGCHGSVFSLEGKPLSGPASRPLTEIPIRFENDNVIIYIPDNDDNTV